MNNIFKEKVYELAFGDGAIDKGYNDEEVLEQIKKFSDDAIDVEYLNEQYRKLSNITFGQFSSIDDFEKAKKEFLDEE